MHTYNCIAFFIEIDGEKKCRNITYIFPECPVVGGGGEGVYGPLLEQAAGHHVDLYLLQDVPQHLVTRL